MQAQAQQTIAKNVLKYTQMLIEALKDNYREYSIRGHHRSVELGNSVEHHIRKIDELKSGKTDIDYTIETGKKYHKVVMIDAGGSKSVHCFIDKNTGEMYKSSSWKSPAKGVRYDLRLIKDREYVLENCDWASGYMYAK
jgi:hypothetical protein